MINFLEGNLFEDKSEVKINTVNCVGVMGKGIALEFKKHCPDMFWSYKFNCQSNKYKGGDIILEWETPENGIVLNLATKEHWRNDSKYEYIEKGLKNLRKWIENNNPESIAIPPLGCGNGNLEWNQVKKMIIQYLGDLSIPINVYLPR